MNYCDMSDFEINCEILAVTEPDVAHMQLSADQKSFFHCGYDGNGFYETVIPDYCNSWADAGPIIEQNGIWLIPLKKGWLTGINGVDVKHEKPLRAAMIAFLMMNEQSHD